MDRNLLLAFALSFLVLTLWSSLMGGPKPPPARQEAGQEEPAAPQAGTAEPAAPTASLELPPPSGGEQRVVEAPAAETPPPDQVAASRRFEFTSDIYRGELTSLGAALQSWTLLQYVDGKTGEPIVLTTGEPPFEAALVTPFEELGLGNLANVAWDVEASDDRSVVFRYEAQGVTLRKSFELDPDSYAFALRIDVENGSGGEVAPRFAVTWPAHMQPGNDFREQSLVVLHEGSLEQQPLQGLGRAGFVGSLFGRGAQTAYDYAGETDWAGLQTTYFLGAVLPDDPRLASARVSALEPGESGAAQIFYDPVRIPPGLSVSRSFRVYAGPKEPALLEAVGGETIRAIDLGWSWVSPLTRFFSFLLHRLHDFVGNYGVAIIVLTILVRVVTTPLTVRQMRSMERMRALQPKLKEIQEKYADDRPKQSEAMMALYRQEKVNPLGGCLPMLLQLPVFIGLFYALRSSIDLRQAPFVGWIDDLSAPESLFELPGLGIPVRILPLVMGATMVLQQRITPMQMDPAQARMMTTIMPVMMTVIFYQFASGLVLYWMVSNVLAISHQLWIGRRMREGH